jgi:CheY-like chemotaxis protein
MDGIEALTRMRALGISQPALAVTAHASAQDHARVLAAGFFGIVTKPVSLDQLHRALDSLGRQDGDDARQAQVFETAAAQLGQQTRDDFVDRMGAEKFATLIRRFVRDAEALLSELTHVEVLSDDQVQNAHNLAGMAGLLGAAEMQNALKMIEDLPQTATPEEAVVILPDLLAEARGSLATLEATPTR